MFITIIIRGFLLLTVAFVLANCSKDHAIMNPNNPANQKPIFSFRGYTSSANIEAEQLQRTKINTTDPLTFLQESHNPKPVIVWGFFSSSPDTCNIAIQNISAKNEWPLKFTANLYDVPPIKTVVLPEHPESWFSVGLFYMYNDQDNNNVPDFKGDKLTLEAWRDSVERYCDSMELIDRSWFFKGFPLSSLDSAKDDSMRNYLWLRTAGKDWMMAQVSQQFMVFCSDSVAAAYASIWADTTQHFWYAKRLPNGLGLVKWTGIKPGYNLMETHGIIRQTLLSQRELDYFHLPQGYLSPAGCDSIVSCANPDKVEVEFSIQTNHWEAELFQFTKACLPWESED